MLSTSIQTHKKGTAIFLSQRVSLLNEIFHAYEVVMATKWDGKN